MKIKKLKRIDKDSGTKSHALNVGVACVLGFPAGLLYNNIVHWVKQNSAKKENKYRGVYWTYNSIAAYMAILPELSREQIRGGLRKLEEHKMIVVDVNNKESYDKTKWYTITKKTPTDLLLENGYELVDVHEQTLNREDDGVCLNTQGVVSNTQGVCSTTNQYHYKPTINPINNSFNKLKDEDKSSNSNSLANLIEEDKTSTPINKTRLIPTEDYKSLQSLLNTWKAKPLGTVFAGSAHKLAPDGQEQSNTIMQIYKGYKACLVDIQGYYEQHEKEFYPLWVSAHNISKEKVLDALKTSTSKEVLAIALRKHLNLLAIGETQENNWELSKSLLDFFMQKRTGKGKEAKSSWLFYHICNPDGVQKEPKAPTQAFLDPTHKYHKYKYFYSKFEDLFPKHNSTLLAEEYVTALVQAKDYRDKGHIKPRSLFDTVFIPLVKQDQDWMDSCSPSLFLTGTKRWGLFIDKLKESTYTKIELNTYEKDNNVNLKEKVVDIN